MHKIVALAIVLIGCESATSTPPPPSITGTDRQFAVSGVPGSVLVTVEGVKEPFKLSPEGARRLADTLRAQAAVVETR